MNPIRQALSIALLASSPAVFAAAQDAVPATATETNTEIRMVDGHDAYPAYQLVPFAGNYQVFRGGKPLGNATMRLVNTGGQRWRIDLSIRGTQGIAGVAGLNIQQSTVFDQVGEQYRPATQSTVQNVLLGSRKTTGIYDWNTHSASWSGDVKKSRRGRTIALQAGDMSGLLINLALMRDARPGNQLSYRFVDDSRMRSYQYATAPATETIQIGEISYDALRVERSNGGNDETRIWVTPEVPLPIRIYMKDNDADALDLLLVDYKGA
ncbi:MAG: DUF3108 domain-containing protein [Pseudomonadota bacterium]|nr:DUF3108 domain-containing protein [Pseudomonadota bacterium]